MCVGGDWGESSTDAHSLAASNSAPMNAVMRSLGITVPDAPKSVSGKPRGRRKITDGSASHATALDGQRKKRKLFSDKLLVVRQGQRSEAQGFRETVVQCIECKKATSLENVARCICGFLARRIGADIMCVRLILVWRELQRQVKNGTGVRCGACRGYDDEDMRRFSLHEEVNRAAHMQLIRTELLGLAAEEQQLPTSLTKA